MTLKQAVLLTSDRRSPTPSQDLRPSGILWVCSPLQWRDRAGISPVFPIKPRRAPAHHYSFVKIKNSSRWYRKSRNGKTALGKRVEAAFFPVISSPSLVGKTVIVKQAVLLTSDRRSPIPSQDLRPSGILWVCSPLQWRDRAGISPVFPIKPRRAPVSASLGLCNLRFYSTRFAEGCQMFQVMSIETSLSASKYHFQKVDGFGNPDLQ